MRARAWPWLLAALLPGAACADRQYTGEARDPERGTLLYEEHHLVRQSEGRPRERIVLYRCPGGAAFARKQVRYDARVAAPEFELEDARFGYREGVRRVGKALAVFVRRDGSEAERQATLEAGDGLVVDAGFDEFVRRHWETLRRGETVALDFLVPSRLETFSFRLRRIGSARIDGAAVSLFRLGLGGMLGWFAPDITVGYRDSDRRLMQFEGLTNIRADRDDNLTARITFPPAREQPGVAPEAWAAAQAEPLRACEPGA